jgi:hypothetical protein
MHSVEQCTETRLGALGVDINTHMRHTTTTLGATLTIHVTQQVDHSIAAQSSHQDYLIEQLRRLPNVPKEYTRQMVGIQHDLSTNLLKGPLDQGCHADDSGWTDGRTVGQWLLGRP